jgi:hypothetical protein
MKVPVLSGLFNRQQLPSPMKDALTLNALNQAAGRTDDDVAWKEQQGTNYELLHDDPLEEVLNGMMYERAIVWNEKENAYQIIPRANVDLNMLGLRLTASHVNRASFNSATDVEIAKCELRAMTKLVKMQCRPDTFSLGMSTFLTGVEYYNTISLNDSVDGKKAKLLKTIPRVTSVEVQTGEIQRNKGAK